MAATHTRGTLLKMGDGEAVETFNNVGKITSFSGPNETAPLVDVTTMDSTAKEYITGLKDSGEVTFDIVFEGNNDRHQDIRAALTSGDSVNWKLVLNDHATEASRTTGSFAGVVTNFSLKGQTDDAWRATVTIRISGATTWAYLA